MKSWFDIGTHSSHTRKVKQMCLEYLMKMRKVIENCMLECPYVYLGIYFGGLDWWWNVA